MTATTRVLGLDGLRGVACIAVFAANFHHVFPTELHFGALSLSRFLEGGAGVVILFVLSGFLLSIPYWNAIFLGTQLPATGVFWLKRLARLSPAYFLALTALIIHNRQWEDRFGIADIILHYLFLFNFAEFSFYSINPPFWALGVIAQFYLVLPVLFFALHRTRPVAALMYVGVIAVGAYVAHVALLTYTSRLVPWPFPADIVRPGGPVLTHSILAHLPHFLMGVIAGFFFASKQQMGRSGWIRGATRYDAWFWGSGIAVLIILSTGLEDLLQVPYGRYVLPWVPGLLAVMIFAAPQAPLTARLLETYPFRVLGMLSYGVYVYQLPVINLTSRYAQRLGLGSQDSLLVLGGAALAITIAIAGFSYFFVERPVLRMTRGFLRQRQDDGKDVRGNK